MNVQPPRSGALHLTMGPRLSTGLDAWTLAYGAWEIQR